MDKKDINELLLMQPLNREDFNQLGAKASAGDGEAVLRLKNEIVCLGVHLTKYYADKYGIDFEILMEAAGTEWFAQLQNGFTSYLQCLDDILTYLHDVEEKVYRCINTPEGEVKILVSHYYEVCKCRKSLQKVSGHEPPMEKIAEAVKIPCDEVKLIIDNELKSEKEKEEAQRKERELRERIAVLNCDELFKEWLFERLWNMNEKARSVMSFRLGLDGGRPRTRAEVAELFQVPEERIQGIERSFFHVCKRELNLPHIKENLKNLGVLNQKVSPK